MHNRQCPHDTLCVHEPQLVAREASFEATIDSSMAIHAPICPTDIQGLDAHSIKAREAVMTKDDGINIKAANSRNADFTIHSPCSIAKLAHAQIFRLLTRLIVPSVTPNFLASDEPLPRLEVARISRTASEVSLALWCLSASRFVPCFI